MGWEMKKLGNLCTIQLGKTPARKSAIYWDTEKATNNVWLSIRDLDHGSIVSDSREYISADGAKLLAYTPEGTLMLSFKLTIGRVSFAGRDLYTNEAIASLIELSPDVDKRFLFYYFSFFDWNKATEGDEKVKGKTMNKAKLKELPILLPPLPEQRRLVHLLDTAFGEIERARVLLERNLRNAGELFESRLGEVFGNQDKDWKQTTLIEMATEFGRGKSKHRPRNDKSLFGGDYPFIQTGDVRNTEKYIDNYTETYNEVGLKQSKLWPAGTICITIAANIAETAILEIDACFPDSVIGMIPDKKKADTNYVFYSLAWLKAELQAQGKGSAQDNINLGTFKKQLFPFPSLIKQKEIAKSLDDLKDEVEVLQTHYTTQLHHLSDLKQSLLAKAFAGDL